MEQLQATFDKLLRETSTTFHRYMHDCINWDARMIGLMPFAMSRTDDPVLFQRQENSKDCLPSSLKVHPLSLI